MDNTTGPRLNHLLLTTHLLFLPHSEGATLQLDLTITTPGCYRICYYYPVRLHTLHCCYSHYVPGPITFIYLPDT